MDKIQKSKPHGYEIWVFIAYGYYFLLGLSWLMLNLMRTHRVNVIAICLLIAFGAQWYFRHLLANLIIGVVCLFGSIFMLLETINLAVQAAHAHQLTVVGQLLVLLPVLSLVSSGILIFSYLKLNFRE